MCNTLVINRYFLRTYISFLNRFRRFTSNSVLKSHLHTHEDSRPYGCSVCNAKFSTQSSMKRHLVTHSNKRPFMCPYCHKTFKTYVNCRKHMKIHKHELAQRVQYLLQREREKKKRKLCSSVLTIKLVVSFFEFVAIGTTEYNENTRTSYFGQVEYGKGKS